MTLSAWPQTSSAQDKITTQLGDSAEGAAIFKTPKGYMQIKLEGFRGVLILDPKKPAGMFISYPDDKETTESLRRRVRTRVTEMFIHGDKTPELDWSAKPLPPHKGDGEGKASLETATSGETEIQLATYERTTGVRPFVYGYFAMRNKSGKGEKVHFIDEQGLGVKKFDELWQSMPGSK
ncbi:MAG TPA: hypothetical protein VGB76_15235 [Pyrinomonadaceae bacterium]